MFLLLFNKKLPKVYIIVFVIFLLVSFMLGELVKRTFAKFFHRIPTEKSVNIEVIPQKEHIYENPEVEYEDTKKALIYNAGKMLIDKLDLNNNKSKYVDVKGIAVPVRKVKILSNGHWSDDNRFNERLYYTCTNKIEKEHHTEVAYFSMSDLEKGIIDNGKIDFLRKKDIEVFNEKYEVVKLDDFGEIVLVHYT